MKFDQLLGPSYTLSSPKADIQRSVNTFRQRVETGQGLGPFVLYRSPGLSPLFQPKGGAGQFRGNGVELNDNLIIVVDNKLYRLSGPTTIQYTYPGTIATDGLAVRIAASGFSVMFVSSGKLYRADATTITQPAAALAAAGYLFVDVVFLDTYYVALTTSNMFFFSSDDGVTWDAADVQTAEASANALVAAIVHYETLFLYGNRITQAFVVGPNPNAPFVPQQSGVIPFGIEAGATLQSLGKYRYWLGRNKDGQHVMYRSQGYAVDRISNFALERKIHEYARDFGVSDAFGQAYQHAGQEFYRIVFPSADASWEFDASSSVATGVPEWSEVSWWDWRNSGFHRHRANMVISAFGKILAGDWSNGWLYE